MTSTLDAIYVVGSTNVDLIMQVKDLPAPGETVGDGRFSQALGGKGANQAVAAARSGANTVFVSVVGGDSFGTLARRTFEDEGIDVSHVATSSEPTGTALIFVDEKGENCIGVAPGANSECTVEAVSAIDAIKQARVVLTQFEIPYKTVRYVLKTATQARRLVNAAPARDIPHSDLALIDMLIVNQTELYQVLGVPASVNTTADELRQMCAKLRRLGVGEVVVTLGKDGAYVQGPSLDQHVPGFVVKVADTTGAGDTFCGAMAARLADGAETVEAVRYAQASAALACTALGAQGAMPSVREVEAFLAAC